MYDSLTAVWGENFIYRGVVLFILGLSIGSFLNVVVYRLPIMLNYKWHVECSQLLSLQSVALNNPKLNLLFPGSHCPECKTKIPFWANIPLLSYIALFGRCFRCKTRISLRYPLVELSTALLFISAGYISSDIQLLLGLIIFFSFVICLILIDYDTLILPDELTLLLMWLGILANLNGLFAGSLNSAVVGAAVGYGSLWLIYWGFKLCTGRDGMGYGDFKFLAAILAWTGYHGLIPITLIASALGIVYFICHRLSTYLTHKRALGLGAELPFGPFLGSAGIVYIFSNHYLRLPW